MEFAYYENNLVLDFREFTMDGRDTRDEGKLDGFNKEEKTSGKFIRHGSKNLESQILNLPVILGGPGNRKLCEVSERFHESKGWLKPGHMLVLRVPVCSLWWWPP